MGSARAFVASGSNAICPDRIRRRRHEPPGRIPGMLTTNVTNIRGRDRARQSLREQLQPDPRRVAGHRHGHEQLRRRVIRINTERRTACIRGSSGPSPSFRVRAEPSRRHRSHTPPPPPPLPPPRPCGAMVVVMMTPTMLPWMPPTRRWPRPQPAARRGGPQCLHWRLFRGVDRLSLGVARAPDLARAAGATWTTGWA